MDIARCFGISNQRVNQWTGEEGLPYKAGPKRKKLFDSAEVHNWLVDRAVKKATTKGSRKKAKDPDGDEMMNDDPGFFDDNLDKYRHYKAEQAKLDLEKARGKLVSREHHETFMRSCAEFVRQGFQAMPRKLGAKVARINEVTEVEAIIEAEVLAILERMSELEMKEDD